MGAKTYNAAPVTEDAIADITNPTPFIGWTSFDSFYTELVKTTGCNPKWKEMLKKHIADKGWLKEQRLWKQGAKHFGIQS